MPKEPVLRCPNANDSCTYPDCNHEFVQLKLNPKAIERPDDMFTSKPVFARSTEGDPVAAVKDICRKMTYKEIVDMADALGIEPRKIDDWAHDTVVLKRDTEVVTEKQS